VAIEDLLENQEMYDLVATIGLGVDDYHNIEEIRYGKIILAADAD